MFMAWLINGLFSSDISDLLQPLDTAIFHRFIPTLVGKPVSDVECALLALPVHLGSLGISDPQIVVDSEFVVSIKVTCPLVDCIIQQQSSFSSTVVDCQHQAKAEMVSLKHQHQSDRAAELKYSLPCDLQCILSYAVETGASSWLTALPIEEHGFALHKGVFRYVCTLPALWVAPFRSTIY